MTITFTLTSGSSLTAAGPFNISGTTSGNVTTQLATGITKNQLLTGYSISGISELTTGGTINSTGLCNTSASWTVSPVSTPTPTPTAVPGVSTRINVYSATTISDACSMLNGPFNVFHTSNLVTGTQVFVDSGLTTVVAGSSGQAVYYYFSEYNEVRLVNDGNGHVGDSMTCPTPTPVYVLKTNLYVSQMDAQTACCSYDSGWYPSGTRFSANLYGGLDISNCIGMVEDTVGDIYNVPALYVGNWWNDLSTSQEFWVKQKVGGDFYVRRFVRDGDNNSATCADPASLCPIC